MLPGRVSSLEPKKQKKSTVKTFFMFFQNIILFIFQKIELSSPKLKKLLYFPQKNFLIEFRRELSRPKLK